MSLTVSIISDDEDFDVSDLQSQIPSPHNDLFGFENWRKLVWGHQIVKDLGCELIYSLNDSNVYVYDEEVLQLKNEFLVLLDNIEIVVKATNNDKSSIEFRIKNALETIKIVEQNLDKVGVALF